MSIPAGVSSRPHHLRVLPPTYASQDRFACSLRFRCSSHVNEIIGREYDAMGEAAVEPLFADPHTHTSLAGARLNARAVILGLKLLHPDPLARYFSPAAADIPDTMP